MTLTGAIETPSTTYTTNDEITFIRGLLTGSASSSNGVSCTNGWSGHGANPEGFIRYARLVLTGMRAYGGNVDGARVRAEILKLMPSMGRSERVPARVAEPAPAPEPDENWDRTTDADYGPKARERRQQERVA